MAQTAPPTPNPVTLVANIATALLGGARPLSRNPVANQIASTTLGIASFGLAPLALALLDGPKKKNDPLKPIKDMERVIRKALAGNRPLTAKEQAYFLKAERGYAERRVGRFPEQDDVFGAADEKDLMQILLHHRTFGDYRARDVLRAVKPYSVKHRRSDKPQRQRLLPVSQENAIRRAQLFASIPPIAEPARGRRWNRDNANFQMKSERVIGRGRLRQMVPAVDVDQVYQQFDAYNALFPEPVAPAPIVQPTHVSPVPMVPTTPEVTVMPVNPGNGPVSYVCPVESIGEYCPVPRKRVPLPSDRLLRGSGYDPDEYRERWAEPDVGPTRTDPQTLGITEQERITRRGRIMSITGVNTSSWAQTIGTIGDALEGITTAIAPALPGIIRASTGSPSQVIVQQPGAVGGAMNPFGQVSPWVNTTVMPGGTTPVFGDLPFFDLAPQGSQGGGAPTTPFRMTRSGNQVAQPFVNTRANGSSEWFIPAGKPKTWTKANVKRRRSCRPR